MSETCPSELALDTDLELSGGTVWADHVASCPRCQERVKRLREASGLFEGSVYAATVDRVVARKRRRVTFRWAWLVPVTILAGLALVLRPGHPPSPSETPVIHDRGAPLLFHLLTTTPAGVTTLQDGAQLAASSTLRFEVNPAAPCWLTVVSVDGNGEVSRLFPADAESQYTERAGTLPGGAQLDGAAGVERFFALCAPRPLLSGDVAAAVKQSVGTGSDAVRTAREVHGLAPDVIQSTALVEKRP